MVAATPQDRKNTVIRDVRDRDGNKLGDIIEPHDGTIDGIRTAAQKASDRMLDEYPDASNMASRIGATDESGNPAWAISPNFVHVNRIGTVEAEATFGNPDAVNKVHGPHSWTLPMFIDHQARTSSRNEAGAQSMMADPRAVKAMTGRHLDLIEKALADGNPVPGASDRQPHPD